VLGIFYDEDKETVATSLSECLATPETTRHWEFRKVRKDGVIIWVRETVRVGMSFSGEIIVLVTCEDITARKRVEEELRKSHAFIRQVIDTDPNFIFAKDRAGRFILVNKAVANVYGTTVEDLIGKTDADFNVNEKEVAFFRQKDLEVMDSHQDLFIPEETVTDSTGRTRWLQTVKRPILDEQGRAIIVLGAATDITERKRMEEALRQRERDLQAALQERERISQDLHDGILQSLFAVGLTLETAKSMMAPRARKTSGPPLDQAIKQLNLVMREIRNFITGLGSDLLQGKDLPTALQHMLASLTENQALRVRLAVEDRAAKAVSTEQLLHLLRVIQEAVSNCIRHGRAREARVSLKMLKQGVRLSIRDNGRGFNPASTKGSGHGLRNMAARAQKIGGRLTVLSKMNEGTRVVLDMPKEASNVPH
jgi:PAS domain S-box-containing protein